jgi:hypothetical protein
MKEYAIIIAAVVLVVAGGLWAVKGRAVQTPGGRACTLEAKLCPDGSAVGRTGPNCEFAACPPYGPVSVETRIGKEVSGLGVRITPLAVIEDSRCPVDVMCIQAGTVRVRARLVSGLGEATQEFKLGQSITTEAERITLTEVFPQRMAGTSVRDSEYVFQFEIAKRQ